MDLREIHVRCMGMTFLMTRKNQQKPWKNHQKPLWLRGKTSNAAKPVEKTGCHNYAADFGLVIAPRPQFQKSIDAPLSIGSVWQGNKTAKKKSKRVGLRYVVCWVWTHHWPYHSFFISHRFLTRHVRNLVALQFQQLHLFLFGIWSLSFCRVEEPQNLAIDDSTRAFEVTWGDRSTKNLKSCRIQPVEPKRKNAQDCLIAIMQLHRQDINTHTDLTIDKTGMIGWWWFDP